MLEPKELEKYIDEDINPGDYIVRELGGEYYVGRVIELSPNFYRYKVLNAFPLGEGVVRHEEAIKCYLIGVCTYAAFRLSQDSRERT
jgi:hypothetical protein